jgi:putative autotransporter adhesin-like protein
MKAHPFAFAARLASIFALAASLPALADQETRELSGFNAIEVSGGIDLVARQGDGFVVEVENDDGDLDEIITEVRGSTLHIRRERSGSFFDWSGDGGLVTVRLPALVSLKASGGSDAETEGPFSGERLEIVASGGSDVTLDVAVGELGVTASGGSDVNLSGTARSLRAQSSGGSDLNASALMAETANVQSSGGSDLSLSVRDSIVANASGGSDISYTGDPRSTNVNSSGGSDIRRR